MTNGTVTMSLADIDKLRDEVKTSNLEKEKALKELIEVKADKRVMKIKEFPSEKDYGISISRDLIQHIKNHAQYSNFTGWNFANTGYMHENLKKYVKVHFNTLVTSDVAFVNFEDAKIELRKQLDKEYEQELNELRSDKKSFQRKLKDKEDDYEEKLADIKKKGLEYTTLLENKIIDWEKKYKELEEGKKEQTKLEELSEEIERLKSELTKEQNKKWYNKL